MRRPSDPRIRPDCALAALAVMTLAACSGGRGRSAPVGGARGDLLVARDFGV